MKVLFVLAPREFRDEEYFEPKKVLEDAGVEIKTACKKSEAESSIEKKRVSADLLLCEAKASDYDAIVFVGGKGSSVYFNDPEAHSLAKECLNKGKTLAAICVAPAILANAGLLKGKKATAYPSVKEILEKNGAHYTGAEVEQDGSVITAVGPQAATAFGKEILRAMIG